MLGNYIKNQDVQLNILFCDAVIYINLKVKFVKSAARV